MSRRKAERRGQTWACTRALWAVRALGAPSLLLLMLLLLRLLVLLVVLAGWLGAKTRSGAPRERAEPPEQPRRRTDR